MQLREAGENQKPEAGSPDERPCWWSQNSLNRDMAGERGGVYIEERQKVNKCATGREVKPQARATWSLLQALNSFALGISYTHTHTHAYIHTCTLTCVPTFLVLIIHFPLVIDNHSYSGLHFRTARRILSVLHTEKCYVFSDDRDANYLGLIINGDGRISLVCQFLR